MQWMNMKLECPTCRTHIPVIDRSEFGSYIDNDSDSDLEVN